MKENLPRGLRNNNPGNIRINGDLFQGEVRPSRDNAFKQFETMAHGYRAIFKILRNYHQRYALKSIRQMISRWAPENENNTEAYIKAVSDYAGLDPDKEVNIRSEKEMVAIVAGMSRVENGVKADFADIEEGWKML